LALENSELHKENGELRAQLAQVQGELDSKLAPNSHRELQSPGKQIAGEAS
jgi:hypothetical protein